MPEWLVERGIGEDRALLIESGEAIAARLHWPGELFAGLILNATLASKPAGARRGTAIDAAGNAILLDRIPSHCNEGQEIRVRITRAPIAEHGRYKRARGQVTISREDVSAAATHPFPPSTTVRRFPAGLWEDVWSDAAAGKIFFDGGSLLFSVTPAMTVVDVDGDLPPRELAMAAVPALVRALRLFDLGGSIGVDFPTLAAKADRKAVDRALDEALDEWPHERTAMNGFGFVHLVARLEGPSLLHRMATSRNAAAARMALRQAEMVEGPGVTLLRMHPAVQARVKAEWIAELERRTARSTRIETDPALAIEGAQAQIVAR